MRYRKLEMLLGAIRRPDLAFRYLAGQIPSEYKLSEVTRHIHVNNPVVLEAGAFDGRDTVRFAQLWPEGKIHAFEPVPSLAARIRTATANFTNVTLLEAALGTGEEHEVELHTFEAEDSAHGSSSILKPGDHLTVAPEIKFDRKIVVRAVTLDDWFESVNSPRIHLMWLDLQGAELQVLMKGTGALRQTDVIHIEVSKKPLYDGGATFRELNAFLKEHGFALKSSRIPVRSGNAIYLRRDR